MKTLLVIVATFLCLFLAVNSTFAQSWSSSTTGFFPWTQLVTSADGTLVYGSPTNGPFWVSTNSGSSWNLNYWPNGGYTTGLACSSDGRVIVAVEGHWIPDGILVSTNFAEDWSFPDVPLEFWTCVASSSDGSHFAAAATNGVIYTSTDFGKTWTQSDAPVENWVSIASSADGNELIVVATNGPICISTNAGETWTTNNPDNLNSSVVLGAPSPKVSGAVNTNWQAVACSADKNNIIAAPVSGPLYLSADAGKSWTASSAPNTNWQAVASSADGTALIAAIKNGSIYTSTNSGITWISNSIPNSAWSSVASSADGSQLAAATSIFQGQSHIYILQLTPHPRLNMKTSNSNLAFSWTESSTNFVVQKSSDLKSWLSLTNAPSLNLSNLQEQVSLAATNSSGFFRLSAQ